MKKILTVIFLMTTIIVNACWFTSDDWKSVYFTRINDTDCTPIFGVYPSYTMDNEVGGQVFPLTVYVHIIPSVTNGLPIKEVLLQWKFTTGTRWKTICTLADFSWILSYNSGVVLFGRKGVNPAGIKTGDSLVFRLQSADDISVNAQTDVDTSVIGLNGWEKLWLFSATVKGIRR